MFDIIKNAELPEVRIRLVYPVNLLNVGDGFDALDNLGQSAKGHSRRKTGIKNSIARFRKAVDPNAKFVVGPSPAAPADTLRCVRTR
jgi:hypothetical protein